MKKLFLTLISFTVMTSAWAVCSGSGTATDGHYTSANNKALKQFDKGYTWQAETTAEGVKITYTILDEFVGLAAPYLFTFDGNGVLIGNPIPMTGWDEPTRTATHTLTGYKDGDACVFLCHMAYVDGQVFFTERVKYIVGSNCDQSEQPTVIGSCKGKSTEVDAFYTEHDAAAANPFINGYEWTCTTTDKGVDIEVKYLDYIEGMAAPYIFFFKDGVLDGGDKAMEFFGQTASYSLANVETGSEINFLVKLAYANHVCFTERISYTVGQNCTEDQTDPQNPDPENPDPENPDPENPDPENPDEAIDNVTSLTPALKVVENGQIVLIKNGIRYSTTGQQLSK